MASKTMNFKLHRQTSLAKKSLVFKLRFVIYALRVLIIMLTFTCHGYGPRSRPAEVPTIGAISSDTKPTYVL